MRGLGGRNKMNRRSPGASSRGRAARHTCDGCRAATWRRRWGCGAEHIAHIGRAAADAWIAVYTQRVQRGAQHILVLVKRGGLEALLHSRSHGECDHMSAAVGCVCAEAFIKNQDQDAILLEFGIIEQWGNIVFEPCVRRGELDCVGATSRRRRAVMSVMIQVGDNK